MFCSCVRKDIVASPFGFNNSSVSVTCCKNSSNLIFPFNPSSNKLGFFLIKSAAYLNNLIFLDSANLILSRINLLPSTEVVNCGLALEINLKSASVFFFPQHVFENIFMNTYPCVLIFFQYKALG